MNILSQAYPLLQYSVKDGDLKRNGPMSPIMAAAKVAEIIDMEYQHVCRIVFAIDTVLQKKDGPRPDDRTYFDHIVIVREYANTTAFFMFIDMGTDYMPSAFYFSDEDTCKTTTVYKKCEDFIIKLTEDELKNIFKNLHLNPETYVHPSYTKVMQEIKEGKHGAEKEV